MTDSITDPELVAEQEWKEVAMVLLAVLFDLIHVCGDNVTLDNKRITQILDELNEGRFVFVIDRHPDQAQMKVQTVVIGTSGEPN